MEQACQPCPSLWGSGRCQALGSEPDARWRRQPSVLSLQSSSLVQASGACVSDCFSPSLGNFTSVSLLLPYVGAEGTVLCRGELPPVFFKRTWESVPKGEARCMVATPQPCGERGEP